MVKTHFLLENLLISGEPLGRHRYSNRTGGEAVKWIPHIKFNALQKMTEYFIQNDERTCVGISLLDNVRYLHVFLFSTC